jgi:hypothetical protein
MEAKQATTLLAASYLLIWPIFNSEDGDSIFSETVGFLR